MSKTTVRGGEKAQKKMGELVDDLNNSIKTLEVGFFSTAKYPPVATGMKGGRKQTPHPVTLIAAWNELGNARIPARPFMRPAAHNAIPLIKTMLKQHLNGNQFGFTKQTANLTGTLVQNAIQTKITSLKTPPNTDRTIKRKGSSNPLIDTGFLRQTVTWALDGQQQ